MNIASTLIIVNHLSILLLLYHVNEIVSMDSRTRRINKRRRIRRRRIRRR